MTEFAPVAPIALLKQLGEDAGHYHLLLAHEVNDRLTEHRDFWDTKEHFDDFVILDNSVIELGYAMPVGTMSATKGVLPFNTIMVLPDIIGDSKGTIDAARGTLSSAKTTGPEGFLGVIQGQSYDELMSCAYTMVHEFDLRYLSVPRHVVERIGSRKHITEAVTALADDIVVHLLGFSYDIEDDMASAHLRSVMGIDSAVPIWNDGELTTKGPIGRRPTTYLNWDVLPPTAVGNIRKVRQWLKPQKDVQGARTPEEHADPGER
jgi:hypothetical protein